MKVGFVEEGDERLKYNKRSRARGYVRVSVAKRRIHLISHHSKQFVKSLEHLVSKLK